MKERILVCESDKDVLRFLQEFFAGRKNVAAEFLKDVPALKERVLREEKGGLVCIISIERLPGLKPRLLDIPVIATIAKNPTTGIRKAIRLGAENYLVAPFHEDDLAYKIRNTLTRSQTIDQLRKRANDLQTIVELTKLVSSTLDPHEILYLIVRKIAEIIPVTRCSIIRVLENRGYASIVATSDSQEPPAIKIKLSKYPEILKALSSKESVIIDDVEHDPIMERVRNIIFPLGIRSIVVVPVVFREEVIGTLFLRTLRTGYTFSKDEIRLCQAIANASSNSLYHAFLFEKIEDEKLRLERLAITDYMTGIYNNRYFHQRLGEEFSRSQRYNLSLSCLMFDIDHFKEINDTYGHKLGDSVLREFAHVLRQHTRQSDVLARYGGEEFIILLPQTSPAGALAKAEGVRAFIEKHHFHGLKRAKRLTASVGVATFPHPAIKNKEDLINSADNALYEAKTSGRNRAVAFKA